MDEANKLVADKLDLIFDEEVKSADGKTLKEISEDLAAECNTMELDDDKYVTIWSDIIYWKKFILLEIIYRCRSAARLFHCLESEASERGFEHEIFLSIDDVLLELDTMEEWNYGIKSWENNKFKFNSLNLKDLYIVQRFL